MPKPFLPLLGERTLLDTTLERMRLLAPPRRTWLVSSRALARPTRAAVRGRRGVRILLEPSARDTAAAISWAAARVVREDPDGLMAVFPADHHIPQTGGFVRAVRSAQRAAVKKQALVLIGIAPSRPDTAYGYIETGKRVFGAAHGVRRFVEKPDLGSARRFVRTGRHFWNAGMVVAPARRVLEECEARAPEVWSALGSALRRIASGGRVSQETLARGYGRVRPLSFDRAVLERARGVLAIQGRFRWSDVGSWDALGAALPRQGGNRVGGAGAELVLAVDARDNIVWSAADKALALVGVEGIVVVQTDDAILVCRADRAQEVRNVVRELERRGRRDLT